MNIICLSFFSSDVMISEKPATTEKRNNHPDISRCGLTISKPARKNKGTDNKNAAQRYLLVNLKFSFVQIRINDPPNDKLEMILY